jgi:hypothetical protein
MEQLVIFSFTDLQISNAVYNPTSGFGLLFQAIGEFPAAVIATFCTMSFRGSFCIRCYNGGYYNVNNIYIIEK